MQNNLARAVLRELPAVEQIIPALRDGLDNRAIVFAKMVVGAMLGKSLDDSIEGKLLV